MSLAYDLSEPARDDVAPEFVACVVPGCSWLYVESDGFDDRCPDCVLNLTEHAAGAHQQIPGRDEPTIDCCFCN